MGNGASSKINPNGTYQPLYVIDRSTDVMNQNIQTSTVTVISSLLAIAASISGLTNFEAFGQQPMADLTQEDFIPLTDNLNAAREAIRDNDTAGAVGELGSAETGLNILMTRVGGEDSPGGQLLVVVRNHIDIAEDASGNSDPLKASQGINAADTELLNITRNLPADGDD
jgi:hypothetical protein